MNFCAARASSTAFSLCGRALIIRQFSALPSTVITPLTIVKPSTRFSSVNRILPANSRWVARCLHQTDGHPSGSFRPGRFRRCPGRFLQVRPSPAFAAAFNAFPRALSVERRSGVGFESTSTGSRSTPRRFSEGTGTSRCRGESKYQHSRGCSLRWGKSDCLIRRGSRA